MKTSGFRFALAVVLAVVGANASAMHEPGAHLPPGQPTCDLHLEALQVVTKDPYTFIYKVTNGGTERCSGTLRIPGGGDFIERGLAFPSAHTPSCVSGQPGTPYFKCETTLEPNESAVFMVAAERFPWSSRYTCLDASITASARELTLSNNVDVGCYDPTPAQVCPGSGAFTESTVQ